MRRVKCYVKDAAHERRWAMRIVCDPRQCDYIIFNLTTGVGFLLRVFR
jgi:hypothetical protein